MGAVRVVSSWHTECGNCGYGRGGWAASPAFDGKEPLTPDSEKCHGCGVQFTYERWEYGHPKHGYQEFPIEVEQSTERSQ